MQKKQSYDYFGTFLDTIEKAKGNKAAFDVPTRVLVELRSGPHPISSLVEVSDGSVSKLFEALDRLEKLGLTATAETAEGKVVQLTEQGKKAAAKATG